MVRRPVVAAATVLAALTGMVSTAGATPSQASLPTVESGPRPGPGLLYADPPDAPQLQNTGPWQAEPILVSGAVAYRDGEWLYQDYLFDDHGATGVLDPGDPYGPTEHLYSPAAGTFTYPTDSAYAHNAADLVELRIRVGARATWFRVTLNTLIDPDRTAFTIALGDSDAARAWPHGAGVRSPAGWFLTVHGDEAEIVDAANHTPLTPAPAADVDLDRRQVTVEVPHEAWDPGSEEVRVSIGVGLWDGGAYLAPQPGPATATTPGGGLPGGPALFNVAPRLDEPTPLLVGATMADTALGARATAPWWRERQQSLQLTLGDVTPFAAHVDFARLHAGDRDDSRVPATGPMNRILASRYVFGQGLDPSRVCFEITGADLGSDCVGRYVGQLQPYALYVPPAPPPAGGYGLTLLLHSLSANYNQYLSTNNQIQLGDRGPGSIVVTPSGRGPDGFYAGVPEADVFEVWADVARHYSLDADWVSVSGYSMGGFGTYRLLARWPDLFARGFSVVGRPGTASDQLVSLRNTPVLAWNAAADELVHVTAAEQAHEDLVAAGVAHTYALFPTADHLTLAGNDEYGLGATFLGEHRVDRDPPSVTYVLDPREDGTDLVADHAYWLSGLELRDAGESPVGTIEVHSAGFGERAATTSVTGPDTGALTGGNLPVLPFVARGAERRAGDAARPADRLEITARNISAVTVDVARAQVSCDVHVELDSDGPVDVVLAGCDQPAPSSTEGAPSSPSPPPHAPAPGEPAVPAPLPATGGGLALMGLVALASGRVLLARRGGE